MGRLEPLRLASVLQLPLQLLHLSLEALQEAAYSDPLHSQVPLALHLLLNQMGCLLLHLPLVHLHPHCFPGLPLQQGPNLAAVQVGHPYLAVQDLERYLEELGRNSEALDPCLEGQDLCLEGQEEC